MEVVGKTMLGMSVLGETVTVIGYNIAVRKKLGPSVAGKYKL